MTLGYTIRYISHNDIDKSKWDRCITESANGLIYARSFYLNIMAGSWDALVLNDYEVVMPLTWKKKYGVCYLYQPYFIPFLGVFGLKDQPLTVMDFLSAIPKKFRYWQIKLNELNDLPIIINNRRLTFNTGNNYLLSLHQSYEKIKTGYKRLCIRMIKKAIESNVSISRGGKPEDVIGFYNRLYYTKHRHISSSVYSNLITATNICMEKDGATIYLASLPDGEITAVYLVLFDDKFVYSLIGGSSEKGKETGSFYLLTDAVIKDHAGSEKIFRFEGSDIPGIAFFDAQFGSELVTYPRIICNRLPFPVNLLKK